MNSPIAVLIGENTQVPIQRSSTAMASYWYWPGPGSNIRDSGSATNNEENPTLKSNVKSCITTRNAVRYATVTARNRRSVRGRRSNPVTSDHVQPIRFRTFPDSAAMRPCDDVLFDMGVCPRLVLACV
jgi:hypothetical protein